MPTNFQNITASTLSLATFLADLPVLRGPWDEAFDLHFCQGCRVQDCNAQGCPNQTVRGNVIAWWLGLDKTAGCTEEAHDPMLDILERAKPKKPTKDSLADRGCPACRAYISWDALNDPLEQAPKFCKECGQALDWSQEADQ